MQPRTRYPDRTVLSLSAQIGIRGRGFRSPKIPEAVRFAAGWMCSLERLLACRRRSESASADSDRAKIPEAVRFAAGWLRLLEALFDARAAAARNGDDDCPASRLLRLPERVLGAAERGLRAVALDELGDACGELDPRQLVSLGRRVEAAEQGLGVVGRRPREHEHELARAQAENGAAAHAFREPARDLRERGVTRFAVDFRQLLETLDVEGDNRQRTAERPRVQDLTRNGLEHVLAQRVRGVDLVSLNRGRLVGCRTGNR